MQEVPEPGGHEWEAIMRRLRPALVAFFARRLSNRGEAEDLTQEVFVRLMRSRTDMRSADAFVFHVAANLLRDKLRADRVRADYAEARRLEDHLGIETLDPFRSTASRQDLQRLIELIGRLPDKTRRIFTLYRFEQVDKRVIAESLGLSLRMVQIHVARALAELAQGMELPE